MKKYKMTVDNINVARRIFCNTECEICPISNSNNGTGIGCCNFAAMYPDKAAELMGLEVVEEKDKPRLTEQELAICKAVGAKWVSRDNNNNPWVKLWSDKPVLVDGLGFMANNIEFLFGEIDWSLFPSISPGDCVNVEELIENEK